MWFFFQNNLYSVEALQKKHESFVKTTHAQQERVEDMKQFATDLTSQEHYASDEINSRCQEVVKRCSVFWEHCDARGKKLQDSKNYQLFLRNMYEVWIVLSRHDFLRL